MWMFAGKTAESQYPCGFQESTNIHSCSRYLLEAGYSTSDQAVDLLASVRARRYSVGRPLLHVRVSKAVGHQSVRTSTRSGRQQNNP